MQLSKGHTLQNGKDPYRIMEQIGQGGFGITYRALWKMKAQGAIGDMDAEIPVVVKEFFWKDYCTREEGSSYVSISSASGKELFGRFKEKLKKEAAILARLRHPNIVRVLDVFEENNTAYMVMQLIEGASLKDTIARQGRLDESTALKYTQQLCSALTHVHHNRILHLDLKPGNVIIDKNDNAQLLDFGISKQYNDRQQETSTTPIGISKGYAPLEQYSGLDTFSPPTDVYALGATLYTMLTGQVPPEATQLAMSDMEPVQMYNPCVSDSTLAAIEKAMEIKPKNRFQTIQEFSDALGNDACSLQMTDETTMLDVCQKSTSGETTIANHPKYIGKGNAAQVFFAEPEMVFVKGGTFMMGNKAYSSERPVHEVIISSFFMGKYLVTQKEWQAIMDNNPSNIKGDNLPVEYVSWHDVQEFINRLNKVTGKRYRLPTEAEWEYAARGGNQTHGYDYSGSNTIDHVAWHSGNSGQSPHPIGSKQPNELGIYDMSGNVWEWCYDWYGNYDRSVQTDSTGPIKGSYRVLRGGSWYDTAQNCRVSNRGYDSPGSRYYSNGFRLVSVP